MIVSAIVDRLQDAIDEGLFLTLQLGVACVDGLARIAKLLPIAAAQRRSLLILLVPLLERYIDFEAILRVIEQVGRNQLILARHALRAGEVRIRLEHVAIYRSFKRLASFV